MWKMLQTMDSMTHHAMESQASFLKKRDYSLIIRYQDHLQFLRYALTYGVITF